MKVSELLNRKAIDLGLGRDLYSLRDMKRKLRNTDISSGVPEFRKILEEYEATTGNIDKDIRKLK